MANGIGIGLSPSFGGGPTSAAIAAPFASVNGTGAYDSWSAEYAATPSVPSPVAFTASRQGYDASGNTTTYLDTLYVTTRVRQPFPNQASNSALTVALSDYIYSTDTPSGSVVNNATRVSPKPVAKWALPGRRTVGNTVRLEVVAAHRNARLGKQVACVVFTATSSVSGTATATVSTPAVLGYTGDLNPIIGYGVDLDVSGLTNDASFTVDAVVYPWIGASTASQRRTVDGNAANLWEFATQTYLKSTSKASSPPLVYITSTGVDATVDANGVNGGNTKVSTNAVTAKANAFATLKSALEALDAATNVTGGVTDGCEVRISNTSASLASNLLAGTYQAVSEVVITRDPLESQSACVFNFGALTSNYRHTWVKVRDVQVTRTGANVMTGISAQLVFENCNFDNASAAGQTGGATQSFIGVTVTNGSAALMGAAAIANGIVRGVSGSTLTVEGNCIIGSNLPTCIVSVNATRTASNSFVGFNQFRGINSSNGVINWGASANVVGAAVVQNLFEYLSATTGPAIRVSADSATGSTEHIVIHNNTFAGFFNNGRANIFYDDGPSARSHILMSCIGNLHVAINTKSDEFQLDGTRQGNWAYMYGVGCFGEWSQYIDADNGGLGTSFAQEYGGIGSSIGTSNGTPQMATSNFVGYEATTSGPNPGGGNGDYDLTSGAAPVVGIVTPAVLPFDLAGTARPTTLDTAGAYVAP